MAAGRARFYFRYRGKRWPLPGEPGTAEFCSCAFISKLYSVALILATALLPYVLLSLKQKNQPLIIATSAILVLLPIASLGALTHWVYILYSAWDGGTLDPRRPADRAGPVSCSPTGSDI